MTIDEQVTEYIRSNPGVEVKAIKQAFPAIKQSTVYSVVRRRVEAGDVEATGQMNERKYFAIKPKPSIDYFRHAPWVTA